MLEEHSITGSERLWCDLGTRLLCCLRADDSISPPLISLICYFLFHFRYLFSLDQIQMPPLGLKEYHSTLLSKLLCYAEVAKFKI